MKRKRFDDDYFYPRYDISKINKYKRSYDHDEYYLDEYGIDYDSEDRRVGD